MTRFSPHLELAHTYWKGHLRPGDSAIDATCGNGHDLAILANILLEDPSSFLIGLDLQAAALEKSSLLLQKELSKPSFQKVLLHRLCHSKIKEIPLPHPPRLIVYNLGYLPGGDKSVTTQTETTLSSLNAAISILANDGALSIMCYPGHPEGEREEKAILAWAQALDPKRWQVSHHRWLNRPASPSLIWILALN